MFQGKSYTVFFIEFWNDNYLVSLFYVKEYVRLFVHNLINNLERFLTPFDDVTLCHQRYNMVLITMLMEMFKLPVCPLHQTDKWNWSGA